MFCRLVILLLLGLTKAEGLPLVETPYGKIQGTYSTSYNGSTFSQFLGIPYAKPPLGQLRFAEPEHPEKWNGIWVANFTTECIQIAHAPEPEGGKFVGDEDCLYLNIYVPRKNPLDGNLLDVIVHIHGGGLNFGYAHNYAGPKYLMDANVIFVTFNYRLGPIGFLSTEDDILPGNNGMKDQSAALRWIKENILHFGGNPDSITITGLSAGGASVHFHYLSPLSKGLFKNGISVSGNVLCPWVFQDGALQKTKQLAASVGCNQKSSAELVNCLKQRSAKQIVESVRMFRPWLYNPFSPFGVVVEKYGKSPFLPSSPYEMLLKGKVQDLPWITSVTSEEGLYPGADYTLKENSLPDLERRWEELAPFVLDYNYTLPKELHAPIAQKVKAFYLGGKPISNETFPALIQMISDRHFVASADLAARLQSKSNKSPVYYYYFSYERQSMPSFHYYWTYSEEKYGVSHGDDVWFVLSMPFRPEAKLSKDDEEMKELMTKMWKSFAKSGEPLVEEVEMLNGDKIVAPIEWPAVSRNKMDPLEYIHIRSPYDVKVEKVDEMGRRSFWESIPFNELDNFEIVKEEL